METAFKTFHTYQSCFACHLCFSPHLRSSLSRCMIKIFRGGGEEGRGGDTFENPSLYEQLLPLPTSCFRMFLERSLTDPPPPHSQAPVTATPFPSTTPSPLKILIIHQARISAPNFDMNLARNPSLTVTLTFVTLWKRK